MRWQRPPSELEEQAEGHRDSKEPRSHREHTWAATGTEPLLQPHFSPRTRPASPPSSATHSPFLTALTSKGFSPSFARSLLRTRHTSVRSCQKNKNETGHQMHFWTHMGLSGAKGPEHRAGPGWPGAREGLASKPGNEGAGPSLPRAGSMPSSSGGSAPPPQSSDGGLTWFTGTSSSDRSALVCEKPPYSGHPTPAASGGGGGDRGTGLTWSPRC